VVTGIAQCSVVTSRRDENPRNRGSISGKGKIFLLHLNMQTGCGTHPGSCFVGVVGSEYVELCCHYTMFVNGTVLRNSVVSQIKPISVTSILILPSHLLLGLPSGHCPSGFPTKTFYVLFSNLWCRTR
jgi:hypothetical protein